MGGKREKAVFGSKRRLRSSAADVYHILAMTSVTAGLQTSEDFRQYRFPAKTLRRQRCCRNRPRIFPNVWRACKVENFGERRGLRKLVEQLKGESGCVLVLGPRVAVRAGDPDRRPLDETLAEQLLASLNEGETSLGLRHAADLHFRTHKDRRELQLLVEEFYALESNSTTLFHQQLAQLPFRLCISASPDSLMLNAFESVGKHPHKYYYHFQPPKRSNKLSLTIPRVYQPSVSIPTVDKPLVYYLFGHHQDSDSLVLTEADLIDYLVRIIKGDPPVPDTVRSMLADESASFLFLGFGFQNWYLRVLLKVLDVYGHRFKSVAFEDSDFVDSKENRHAIAFFEDRFIEFHRLRWEPFAEQLLETYHESLPAPKAGQTSPPALPGPRAPCAFLSYASEDQDAVEWLAENLQAEGILIWQDKQNLRGGDRWNEVLLTVIPDEDKVHYVIVLHTTAMVTATRGVFRREIEAALEVQKEMGEFEGQRLRFLIPVTINHCRLLSSLRSLQAVDVSEPDGVNRLATAIKEDWERRGLLNTRRGDA
jgi:hypothetical protein